MSLRPRTLPAGFIAPCLPTSATQPPSGSEWLIEIKHDGFRVIARKQGNLIRLYSRPGNDLTHAAARLTLQFRPLSLLHYSNSKNPNAPAVKREAEEDWGSWKSRKAKR
jgi:ATP dependent DNA ligase domain